MSGEVKVAESWKGIEDVLVKTSESWTSIAEGYVKVNEGWKSWFVNNPLWISVLGDSDNTFQTFLSAATDSEDNIYLAGYTTLAGDNNRGCLLVKYRSDGVVLWQKTLFGAELDEFISITIDSLDNIYVTGYTKSQSTTNVESLLIAKYDSSGFLHWQRTYENENGSSVQGYYIETDSENDIVVTGHDTSQGNGFDMLVMKISPTGSIKWKKVISGNGNDAGRGVAIDSLDNIYVSGYTTSQGVESFEFHIVKLSSSGDIQWQRSLGGMDSEFSRSIAIDIYDNVYVSGYTRSAGQGSNDGLIVKYNSFGEIQWQKTVGGTGTDIINHIAVGPEDKLYLVGYTGSELVSNSNPNAWIAQCDLSGSVQWQRSMGGTGILGGTSTFYANSISFDSKNNIYVCGSTRAVGEGPVEVYAFVAKLLNNGEPIGTYSLAGEDVVYEEVTLDFLNSDLTETTGMISEMIIEINAVTSSLVDSTVSIDNQKVRL